MKQLKHIRQGTTVRLPLVSELHTFIRGEASNGRVHLKCYHGTTGERYTHLDRYLKNNTKVKL